MARLRHNRRLRRAPPKTYSRSPAGGTIPIKSSAGIANAATTSYAGGRDLRRANPVRASEAHDIGRTNGRGFGPRAARHRSPPAPFWTVVPLLGSPLPEAARRHRGRAAHPVQPYGLTQHEPPRHGGIGPVMEIAPLELAQRGAGIPVRPEISLRVSPVARRARRMSEIVRRHLGDLRRDRAARRFLRRGRLRAATSPRMEPSASVAAKRPRSAAMLPEWNSPVDRASRGRGP